MLFPVPADVTPQESENHSATAAVPGVPPFRVRVVESPLQMVVVPVMLIGATESVFTVTVTEAQVEVLQVPLYRTK